LSLFYVEYGISDNQLNPDIPATKQKKQATQMDSLLFKIVGQY